MKNYYDDFKNENMTPAGRLAIGTHLAAVGFPCP